MWTASYVTHSPYLGENTLDISDTHIYSTSFYINSLFFHLSKSIIVCFHEAISAEAVAGRCSVKKVFLKILQNSQENIGARVSILISCRP